MNPVGLLDDHPLVDMDPLVAASDRPSLAGHPEVDHLFVGETRLVADHLWHVYPHWVGNCCHHGSLGCSALMDTVSAVGAVGLMM